MENVNLNAEVVAEQNAEVANAQRAAAKPAAITRNDMHLSTLKAGLIGAGSALAINLVDQAITENWSMQRTACTAGATIATGGIIAACHSGLDDVYDNLECKSIEGMMAGTWGMSFGIMLGSAANGLANTTRQFLAADKADTEEFMALVELPAEEIAA